MNDPSASDTGARAAGSAATCIPPCPAIATQLEQMVEATGAPPPGAPGTVTAEAVMYGGVDSANHRLAATRFAASSSTPIEEIHRRLGQGRGGR